MGTPLKLLQEVFKALQLCDLVDLLGKEKPRTLLPSLPLWAKIEKRDKTAQVVCR